MKKRVIVPAIAAVAALFALSGCDTFASRAREKSETYQALPPATQQRLARGRIAVGDTQDMVYIALGHPDERRTVMTNDGTQELWIYRTYWEQYEGTAWVGYHRVIVPAPNGRGYLIYHEPITQDVYSQHADEFIRVQFARGVVSSIEQSNRR